MKNTEILVCGGIMVFLGILAIILTPSLIVGISGVFLVICGAFMIMIEIYYNKLERLGIKND